MSANLENSAVATGLEKVNFHLSPKKSNDKEISNYYTIVLISLASKVMLKILQARFQQYMNRELPDGQAGFRKGRGIRDYIANIHWIMEKAREFQKNICFIVCAKAFSCVNHYKLYKTLKRWEYQSTLPTSWEICILVKKQQLEPDMEQRTGSKLRKECQSCILSPCLFNFYAEYIMQKGRLDEAQAGIKIARRNINNLRYTDDITLMAKSREEVKILLLKVKEESEKTGLKLNN